MRRASRVAVMLALVLAVGSFGINDLSAICGAPGMVAASVFAGGTGTVILFNPLAPFNFTGLASVPLGGVAGQNQFNLWLDAITTIPTNFLYVVSPGAGCGGCVLAPPGPFPACPGATISIIYD